jgi:N6-L-threonylcarbamoyladenine synthase
MSVNITLHYSSGIKVAVERLAPLLSSEAERRSLAYAFQVAAFAQITDKIKMCFSDGGGGTLNFYSDGEHPVQDLVVSGGVASNQLLRQAVQLTLISINRQDVRVHFPPVSLCTDNAAMIAHAGLVSWNLTRDLTAIPQAKWSVEDLQQE